MSWNKALLKDTISPHGFRDMPLQELADRIVRQGERESLEELVERRPLFRRGPVNGLLLADYVHDLWRRPPFGCSGDPTSVLDKAHDITLDKFTRLSLASQEEPLKRSGPDCRYYYKAFLEMARKNGMGRVCESEIELECALGRLLQAFVTRHFHLSLLEARRSANPSISRYVWRVNGKGAVTLWMPKALRGVERKTWLEKNVVDCDPSRPGERDRVQAIIDTRLSRGGFVPLHQVEYRLSRGERSRNHGQAPSLPEEGGVDLAQFIAAEKADSIDLQRPAIRAIGPVNLRALVLAVFENITEEDRSEEELAAAFGLSKAAFSRFAGSRWNSAGADGKGTAPDLWLNVAHVLASNQRFIDTARQAGVFRPASDMTRGNARVRLRFDAHD